MNGSEMKKLEKGVFLMFLCCVLIAVLGASCPKYLSIDVETEKEKVNIKVENPDK